MPLVCDGCWNGYSCVFRHCVELLFHGEVVMILCTTCKWDCVSLPCGYFSLRAPLSILKLGLSIQLVPPCAPGCLPIDASEVGWSLPTAWARLAGLVNM